MMVKYGNMITNKNPMLMKMKHDKPKFVIKSQLLLSMWRNKDDMKSQFIVTLVKNMTAIQN